MMRVATCARVSSKGVGKQDAENQLRSFAATQGWILFTSTRTGTAASTGVVTSSSS